MGGRVAEELFLRSDERRVHDQRATATDWRARCCANVMSPLGPFTSKASFRV